MGMLRLFVAIDPEEAVAEGIDRFVSEARIDAFKWVARRNYHLTLRFLGATPEGRLPAIQAALAEVAGAGSPIPLDYQGVGAFPPAGNPRVLWIGVEDPTGRLRLLEAAVRAALAGLGADEGEREFVPHLTIARARPGGRIPREWRERLARERSRAFGFAEARELILYRSETRPEGARYEAVGRFSLGGGETGLVARGR